jgi:undecaprenyl diphosphate synthase
LPRSEHPVSPRGMSSPQALSRVPTHIAIIMDGNGRWAQARGLPRLAGHRAGTENLRRILTACVDFGVKILTIWAFSTENWRRPQEEVHGLMDIVEQVIDRELNELHKNGVRLRHVGRLEGISKPLQTKVRRAIELTQNNNRLVLNVAFNYGGKAELLDAIQRMIADGVRPEDVDEELVTSYLYTAGLPDPDMIIRTGNECRISNFMLWQGAYSEYYFTSVLWPDFDKEELRKALEDYAQRERRFGRTTEQVVSAGQ